MSYSVALYGPGWYEWRQSVVGIVFAIGTTRTVSIGSTSESFTQSGSVFVSDQGTGSTLTFAGGIYTYTSRDGTVMTFAQDLATMQPPENQGPAYGFGEADGYLTRITYPHGEDVRYHYNAMPASRVVWEGGIPVLVDDGYLVRLAGISNNFGYQLYFEYALQAVFAPPYDGWNQVVQVTAFNSTVDYCLPPVPTVPYNPFPITCSFTQDWPSLSFGHAGSIVTVTDNLSQTSRFTFSAGRVTGVRAPGSMSDDVTYAYGSSGTSAGRITSVTFGGTQVWSYGYTEGGGNRTTTVTSPLSATESLVSDLSTGLPVSSTNGVSQTTSLLHDAYGRVTRVTYPEGNQVRYTYDGRGNVTEVRRVAKPSTGLADLVTSAGYPATCTNVVTCNQASWTEDAGGNRTDYTYDSTHGGVLTVTSPAPSGSGDRPQTRYSYSSLYAWYNQGSGIAQAPSPVWRLTQVSACASGTSPSCVGTANETRTTIGYGSASVANNRLPVSTTVAAGNGTPTSTISRAYDIFGNVTWSEPAVGGASARSYYFYDALRRPAGVIGPDPDGGGALLRQAARIGYTVAGQESYVERGTATGTSVSDLASMTVIERQETEYDALYRPVAARLKSGATILALQQVSYDASGRLLCSAVRMNPGVFGSPPSDACTLGTTGTQGPDRITHNTRNGAGQITEIRNGYGTAEVGVDARYAYTANGHVDYVRDGADNRTTYVRDGHDRLYQIQYPVTTTGSNASNSADRDQFTYDAAGRLATHRLRSGDDITYAYDNLNRITARNAPSPQPDITYTYDLLGRVLQASQTGGHTLTYTYDALGRNLTAVTPQGTVSYQYDASGRRTRMDWPDGLYVTYDYAMTGALTHIRENGAGSGIGVLAAYAYDNLGRVTSLTRGNGVVTGFDYDAAGRLDELTQDLSGTDDDQALTFTYNAAGQIASRTMANDIYAFAGHTNQDVTITVDGLNRFLSGGGVTYSYDNRGNMTTDGVRSYAYDFDNRLTSVTGGGGGDVSLSYDPAGRLYQTAQVSGATTRFLYDGANLIGEYD
ncbi:MAG: hypothetical protein ACQRW7_04590, partial [Caulobacterales bacterium]|uniref:RHS repeat domain-containing protein n=1 Tax=Glycocaulis sp. TaxID=1969725 RepID=UPI003F9FA9F9